MKPAVLFVLAAVLLVSEDGINSLMVQVDRAPGDRALLDRTSRYLDGERSRLSLHDSGRAFSLARAYRRIAVTYGQLGYFPGALRSYHGAFLILNGIAAADPRGQRVRNALVAVVGSVRALGGTVPIWVSVPGVEPLPEERAVERADLRRKEPAPEFELPNLDSSQLPPDERKACDSVMERYLQVSATAGAALTVLADVRASVQSHGLSLRTDYVAAEYRIKGRMAGARRSIEDRRFKESEEALAIVSEDVRRLLRELGQ